MHRRGAEGEDGWVRLLGVLSQNSSVGLDVPVSSHILAATQF